MAPNMIWALALLGVLNAKYISNQSSTPTQPNAQGFYAFIPWLILNAQERIPAEPSSIGIPKFRRWWPGTLDWTTIRSDFGYTDSSLISYHHRKYHVSKYELGCRQNGSWHAHRAGPLLIQRGTSTHVVSTRFDTWEADGTITFADTTPRKARRAIPRLTRRTVAVSVRGPRRRTRPRPSRLALSTTSETSPGGTAMTRSSR